MKKSAASMASLRRLFPLFPILLTILHLVQCQPNVNRAPQFLPNGDMSRFAIKEDTLPGSPVYKLQGADPEGSSVLYSISGEFFTVDKSTGVVTLAKPLDREVQEFVSVVISITDEGVGGSQPNTISLLREIPVLDINDNAPTFEGRPYSLRLFESIEPGSKIFKNITVTDKDGGVNGDVILTCIPPTDPVCSIFDITTEKLTEGSYQGVLTLLKPLDFERQRSYSLTIRASDRAKDPSKRLSTTANVAIEVLDVQDQTPIFLNAPYSATAMENTLEDTSILRVAARDGDVGDPRPVRIDILDDVLGCFQLIPVATTGAALDDGAPISAYDLITTDEPLDREHPDILDSGGIYSFRLRATELINGEVPADFSDTTVTIVVTDDDDQLPTFNSPFFHVNVSESIGTDSPLPGLNMMITDGDVGDNARYLLSLRDVSRSAGVVTLHPREGQGHTVVVLRVNDTSMLDYDTGEDDDKTIVFDVVAAVQNEYGVVREVASSSVFLYIQDANDNAPTFPSQTVHFTVPEDIKPGSLVAPLVATDKDSGMFGRIRYLLKGYAASKFKTDEKNGGIYVGSSSLDYESQKSYTLTLMAIDGGNRSSSLSVHIDIADINDNAPKFEMLEFSRTVRSKSSTFQPEFFVKATDADGVQQGGGKLRFEIIEKNFEDDILDIDEDTGEVVLHGEASAAHTPKGQYEMTIRAWDYGSPPKSADARVNVRVGYVGNQRPFFRGNAKHSNGISFYNVTVPENAKPDMKVYQLEAVDPDGAAGQLVYHLPTNGKDNFAVDPKSGLLKTSTYVDLDLERNPMKYILKVEVVDMGFPVAETGSIEVVVHVTDVNNKPPKFQQDTYTFYVDEEEDNQEAVIGKLTVTDPDLNPDIEYRIKEPSAYYDKAGLSIKAENLFKINENGEIGVTKALPVALSNAVLKIEAEDKNGEEGRQITQAEVSIYVQSLNDMMPVFLDSTWNARNRSIHIDLDEETPAGSTIYHVRAKDPVEGGTTMEYQVVKNDYPETFSIDDNGEIRVLQRLDYENQQEKMFKLGVRVVILEDLSYEVSRKSSGERVVDLQQLPNLRFADATLIITLQNINDFSPVFQQDTYRKRVLENVKHPEVVLQVKAVDFDRDQIVYSLSGESAALFEINRTTGELRVRENSTLDRERQAVYKLTVTAKDVPQKGMERQSQAAIWLEALDVNDNPPAFLQATYSTVIPENVPPGTKIATVRAVDPDLGPAGEVRYSLAEEGEVAGVFTIDAESGEISTNRVLTGRGRSDPYHLTVRAVDRGDSVIDADGQLSQQSYSSDVPLVIYIGDVVKNDGVPVFIRPEQGQTASVSEDSPPNTPVFQVIATDPDDPNSAEGQIRYKFLREGKQDHLPFKINHETGMISTKSMLDREKKASYQIIVVAHDRGDVPQEATRLLLVNVLDVDDHPPQFVRTVSEQPLQMRVQEESPVGTEVGVLQCDDPDVGDNAAVDYVISDGNPDGIFTVERSVENVAVVRVAARVDREKAVSHLLTIKCYKLASDGKKLNYLRPYNSKDLSERQVLITLEDIDDNGPVFSSSNITLGVRLNVPVDTRLTTLEAADPDTDSAPLHYRIESVAFRPAGKTSQRTPIPAKELFAIDSLTGELRTVGPMRPFADGVFYVLIVANNSADVALQGNVTARIFVLRDRSLLKFVFDKTPRDVQKVQPQVEKAVAAALGASAINMYDTQFHTKQDGSLDFSSTSSCFQVLGNRSYSVDELERLFNSSHNPALRKAFHDFSISGVERCAGRSVVLQTSWVQIWVLVVAAAIGVLALISAVAICCCFARYKRAVRKQEKRLQSRIPRIPVPSVASMADYMTLRHPGSTLRPGASVMGSQMYLGKGNRSTRESQLTLSKGGGSMLLSQPATQMGSQLIINPNKSQPIIMGSQMLTSRNGLSEAREQFGSQIMYEYVQDGTVNLAYEDS